VASGDPRLCGSIVDIDETTGRATDIRRLCVQAAEAASLSAAAARPAASSK